MPNSDNINHRTIASKIWAMCNVLRGDGISYNQYISELTYLLFLKLAEKNGSETLLPKGYRWVNLVGYRGENLLGHYQEMLTHLGASAPSSMVRDIFSFPTTVFSHSENLRVVIDALDSIDWRYISDDGIGKIYEALLSKNSEDARSGAGQYFTPRPLVECIINVIKPKLGETIQDPAAGTGGFLICADEYIRANCTVDEYSNNPPKYEGMEIERGAYRLCLMNTFLHRMNGSIRLGDALTKDGEYFAPADVILANPPFGAKSGSVRANRGGFAFSSSNKQLEFLQHIYHALKPGGRAAVVVPDNVLFEDGVARLIRQELMEMCNLHTILRLPSGIFYAQGVKTSVLFFTRGKGSSDRTTETWFYDLRAGSPKFGKRNSLNSSFFSDFISAFGRSGPQHNWEERVESEKYRRFSRAEIADDRDNLDIRWLKSEDSLDDFDGLRPDEISGMLLTSIIDAMKEVEALHSMLIMEADA